jgi:hypothetical protein
VKQPPIRYSDGRAKEAWLAGYRQGVIDGLLDGNNLPLLLNLRSHRRQLDDPRLADDYNPVTGECDGVPYWQRPRAD